MGRAIGWLWSFDSDFNRDFGVSFTPEALARGEVTYGCVRRKTTMSELPGIGVFFGEQSGGVFDTYSCYARGLDMVNGAYHFLDLTPKGRDEAGLPYTMAWVRLRGPARRMRRFAMQARGR